MVFFQPFIFQLLNLSLLDSLSCNLISHCLSLGNINVVLGISLLHVGDLLEFVFDCLSLMHLSNKVCSKIVVHHHIHVIRRKRSDAKLDLVEILSYILWKRLSVFSELCSFLCFFQTFVLVFTHQVEVLLKVYSFEAIRELLLENLELKQIDVSFLSLFVESHELIESHEYSF